MSTEFVKFGNADLTSCDHEQIHVPGSIQPYGVLFVVDRQGFVIEQVAGQTEFLLGLAPAHTLGMCLCSLLDEDAEAFITESLAAPATFIAPVIRLGVLSRSAAMPLDLTLSADGRSAIVELEPARRARSGAADPIAKLKTLVAALQQSTTIEQCLAAAAVILRATTGFDRAMVYRFLADGSGVVAAEDVAPGLESFLGLHYPASDIPRQARELYKRNWLRAIPQVNYVPALLQPPLNPRTGQATDMSYCALRSVSPIHREYLRNMGVTASLSISVVCQGELWGLLALHHYSPRHVPADLRVACETFAQIFSLQIDMKSQAERSLQRIAARRIREELVAGLADTADVGAALVTNGLSAYVRAGGAAVYFDDRLHTVGVTPPDAELMDLIGRLNTLGRPLFSSSCLADEWPDPPVNAAIASGVLAISLSRAPRDYVMWFRPGLATTVRWAGNPAKPVTAGPDGQRLTPRGSFALWFESNQEQAEPWSDVDAESAEALRVIMLESVLKSVELQRRREREKALQRQSSLLAELDLRVKQLERSNQDLEDFASIASHDLKAPLNGIRSIALWLEEDFHDSLSDEARNLLGLMRSRINRMETLLDDLLTFSRISHGDTAVSETKVADIFDRIIAVLNPPTHIQVRVEGELPQSVAAGAQVEQVLRNLINNAIKHHDRPNGEVVLSGKRAGDFVEFVVRDDGPGILPQFHDKIFQLFQTLKRNDEVEGSGMGLAIVKKLVERQNCCITVHSQGDGTGTEFRFQWPAVRSTADREATNG